jgi:diadenylate cyclase
VSDAVAVVVSEETGSISIAHSGRMIRRLDPDRLENILAAFFRPDRGLREGSLFTRFFPYVFPRKEE